MNDIDQLVQKLFQGTCTKEELELLFEHIKSHPLSLNASVKEKLWEEISLYEELDESSSSAILQRTLSIINEKEENNLAVPISFSALYSVVAFTNRKHMRLIISVAASICIIGLFSWLGYSLLAPTTQTISTKHGEWNQITLSDGSKVSLNAHSHLTFSEHWGEAEDRKVWLTGEAFFEVVKDPYGAKFTVFANGLAIEVLGTAFNVHSRGENTEVYLEEGKVKLHTDKEKKFLKPGDVASYSHEKKAIVAVNSSPDTAISSWKDGALFLKDQPVEFILYKIQEIYGYEIVVTDKELLTVRKTIGIPMNKIEIAIPILEKVLEADITVSAHQLVID